MSFKTILSVVGAKDAVSDISKAIELSTELDAHLSILAIGTALPPIASDYPVATAWIEQRQAEINALLEVRQNGEDMCRSNGVSFDTDYLYDDRFILESNLSMRALYADLVLLGDGARHDSDIRKAVVAGTVFDAHVPLLLAPAKGKSSLRPKNVLLAWNSRAEAARAAKEALHMLIEADAVHVVIVDPDSSYFKNGGEPGADIAAFLARHGVKVVVEQVASGERSVEVVLRQHALEIGCDMIVMGAYGHSRLRERVFGGVTASILEDCEFPVFFAR
ncbi:universal stress protein [Neorhizobium sp. LjRoot104]|uniref:universal stress protein n=1 Tax=Neorhizobium sp. LjRoot104 TaxID=3342254 RepID=UPI003ECFF0B3